MVLAKITCDRTKSGRKFSAMKICLLKIWAVVLSIVSIGQGFARESENNYDFNKNYFGAFYTPYVKIEEAGAPIPHASTYTFENVQTQLEIVSTKFSKIYTHTVDCWDVHYVKNFTYYHQSYVGVRTAEAAALLNLKMNKTLLTVTLGISDNHFNNNRYMRTKVNVALEAVEIANSIYPGTVETSFIANFDTTSLDWTNSAIYWINLLRQMSPNTGLKVGTMQYCGGLSSVEPNDAAQKEIWIVRKAIVKESDFIICSFEASERSAKHRAKFSLGELRNSILRYRPLLQSVNPQIEVMWETEWSNDGDKSWENLKEFGDYWSGMNKFASENNFTGWMSSAFDSPLIEEVPLGWWKLTSNALVNNASGYVEKVSGMTVKLPTATEKSHFGDSEIVPSIKPVISAEVVRIKPDDSSVNTISSVPVKHSIQHPKTSETSEKDDIHIITQIIIVILSIALLSVLMYVIWSKYRKKTGYTILAKRDIDEFKYGLLDADVTQVAYSYSIVNTFALNRPYDRGLEIAKSKLEILYNQVLGGGQFGCIYKAILRNGMEKEVAVKMTRHDCLDMAIKGILSEIKILSYLGNHPNIVSIIGAYTAEIKSGIVYLVLELCSMGSLRNYLRNFRSQDKAKKNLTADGIPLGDMIRWSHEIACGMQYLEEKNVIHADLATRNVLLNSDLIAKITDFGLARRLQEYSVYTKQQQEPLPWRWMAIESLKKTEFSIKSDVWSYGVTLWEIFSFGALPFPGRSWNDDFIKELEHETLRLGRPTDATDEMYEIMLGCWKLFPKDRPKFVELTAQIKLIHDGKEKHEADAAKNPGRGDFLLSYYDQV